MAKTEVPVVVTYSPPTKGFLSYLPSQWVTYAELIRIHKPAGILYIYFPYIFGSLFAASIRYSMPSLRALTTANLLLFAVAFIVRSIGCSWNDIVDRELGCHVARCRIRPIARGALTPKQGYIFTAFQYLLLFCIVKLISPQTLIHLVPVIVTGLSTRMQNGSPIMRSSS